MKAFDVFGYSFNAIKLRKLRAALTTLGVIIGIAAIVALLSITQGLQTTLTGQLNQGLSADTLIITAGSSGFGAGSGGGFGGASSGGSLGGGGGDSDFVLYANYTGEIAALSPDIEAAVAVMSHSGYIESDKLNTSVTIYGVDFNQYSSVYSTFQAENGSIPSDPSENDVVVGTRVNQPGHNGTIYFTTGSTVNVTWMNARYCPQ
jgi:putative ABC transport system permease protein